MELYIAVSGEDFCLDLSYDRVAAKGNFFSPIHPEVCEDYS